MEKSNFAPIVGEVSFAPPSYLNLLFVERTINKKRIHFNIRDSGLLIMQDKMRLINPFDLDNMRQLLSSRTPDMSMISDDDLLDTIRDRYNQETSDTIKWQHFLNDLTSAVKDKINQNLESLKPKPMPKPLPIDPPKDVKTE